MGVTLWPEQKSDALVPAAAFELHAIGSRPHVSYRDDPIRWAVEKLGIPEHTLRWSLNSGYDGHRWDGDIDPLAMLYQAIANSQDAGVESGTGTGKSFGVAVLILWFLACWENALAFTFAPTEKQLKLYIWKNITELWSKFHRHFPQAELTELCIRMRGGIDESWAAHGYAVGIRIDESIATRAAGMHAPDMLLVYEETPGIPHQVMEAGENTCTAPHNLRVAIGNPNHKLDALHKFCTSPGVVHIRMSALDHPNVVAHDPSIIPGAISEVSIARRLAKYGESSPVYQSRVKGVSPEQASDALIRYEWLLASAARYVARGTAGTIPEHVTGKGVDVANSEHGDRACIADWRGNCLPKPRAFACPDANKLGRQVALEIGGTADSTVNTQPYRVGVDTIGVGAGTYNELARLGRNVQRMVASARPVVRAEKAPDGGTYEWATDGNLFRHQRDQWYWQLREDLRLGLVDIEKDEELWEELLCPTFVDEPQTIIEPKDEIRSRLSRSPDKADATVMGNWVRERKAVVSVGKVPGEKQPHQARPLTVKDGKLEPAPRLPKTIDELVDYAVERSRTGRSIHRERLPRRKYA